MNKINVAKASLPPIDDYLDEIRDMWESRWLTNMGTKHKELEKGLVDYLQVKNIALFTNGHLALESAIEALDLSGEVITTPFTFASTTHAIVRQGLKAVFCDINYEDYTIDTDLIEELITEETSAIIPVHVYGNVCNLDKIEKIAKKHKLKVIYDAAHAFGVEVNGCGIGNYGDASMFSFHATKVFNTIEGGAVTFADKKLGERLNLIKNFGISGPETVELVGTNAKMSEFQAAMGLCNLKYVNTDIEKRKLVKEGYDEHLAKVKGIKVLKKQEGVKSNYAYYPILIDGYKKDREEIYRELQEQGINTRKYFSPLITKMNPYKDIYDYKLTPVASHVADRILCLPIYPDIEDYVFTTIREVIS